MTGLLDVGINQFRDLFVADVYSGIAGTSSSEFLTSQTGLISPDATTEDTTPTFTLSNKTVSVSWIMDALTGNGNTYYEWGIKGDSGNVYYTRTLTAGVPKTQAVQITRITVFYFDRE